MPDPSSLAPGASAVEFITSVTRLSIWPGMMTTSLGRSVPRWIATMSRTRVGVGMRAPVKISDGSTMVRQLPQAAESRWNSPRAHSSAAPMPRLGSVCDDSVWRVPKPTSVSIVCLQLRRADRRDDRAQPRIGRRRAAPRRSGPGWARPASLRITTLLSRLAQLAFARLAGLGEPATPNTSIEDAYPCCAASTISSAAPRFASGERQGDVFDPNQGQVQAHVRLGTAADLQKAVDAAKAAQPAWAATNPQRRARVMFKYKELVEAHMDELAAAARARSTARSSPTPRATSSAGSR